MTTLLREFPQTIMQLIIVLQHVYLISQNTFSKPFAESPIRVTSGVTLINTSESVRTAMPLSFILGKSSGVVRATAKPSES